MLPLCCLLAISCLLHCSVFKVRPFRLQFSLKPDPNVQFLERLNPASIKDPLLLKLSSLPYKRKMVGQSGLEPPTSRLSVVCSNQLSYWPASSQARPLRFRLRRKLRWLPCSSFSPQNLRFRRVPLLVVEVNGLEPMTPCLQSRCSTS